MSSENCYIVFRLSSKVLMISNHYRKRQSSLTLFIPTQKPHKIIKKLSCSTLPVPSSSHVEDKKAKSDIFLDDDAPICDIELSSTIKEIKNDGFRFSALPMPSDSEFVPSFVRNCQKCISMLNDNKNDDTNSIYTHCSLIIRDMVISIVELNNFDQLTCAMKEGIISIMQIMMKRKETRIDIRYFAGSDFYPTTQVYWPLTQQIYRLIIYLFQRDQNFYGFSDKFFESLFLLIGTPDHREREQIAKVFEVYMGVSYNRRIGLIKKLLDVCRCYQEIQNPFSIHTALLILNNAFRLFEQERIVIKNFFQSHVLYLTRDRLFSVFQTPFLSFLSAYLSYYPEESVCVLSSVVQYWPITKISKQEAYLKIMLFCLPNMEYGQITMIFRSFGIISNCLRSQSLRVAEISCKILQDPSIHSIIMFEAKQILQIVLPGLYQACNSAITSLKDSAKGSLQNMARLDPRFILNLRSGIADFRVIETKDKLKHWAFIARTAAKNDENLQLGDKLGELTKLFNSHPIPSLLQLAQAHHAARSAPPNVTH